MKPCAHFDQVALDRSGLHLVGARLAIGVCFKSKQVTLTWSAVPFGRRRTTGKRTAGPAHFGRLCF